MKIHGIKRAVAEFNGANEAAVVWLSPGFGAVETKVYKEPLNFSKELCCRFIPLEVKGIGGIREEDSKTSCAEIESDILFVMNGAVNQRFHQ